MKRPMRGSTPKQFAYATRRLSGGGTSKKEIALLSGYTPSMAKNAKYKIEETDGYNNAIAQLAADSNNLLIAVIAQFKSRGLDEFSNKDLIGALNAITHAWDKIDTKRAPAKMKTEAGNPLRAIFTERTIRTATLVAPPTESPAGATQPETKDAEFSEAKEPTPEELDF